MCQQLLMKQIILEMDLKLIFNNNNYYYYSVIQLHLQCCLHFQIDPVDRTTTPT